MSTISITPQLKATMLKQLLAGHDLDYVAQASGMPRDRVLDIVSNHGYPNRESMARAAGILLESANRIPERQATVTSQASGNGHRNVRRDEPAPSPRPTLQSIADSHRVIATPPVSPARPVHTSAAELLHQAGESAHARTRGLGAKISALLADLTTRLDEEQEAREAKAKAERENAQVAAKIARLEAELAQLKGKRSKPARAKSMVHAPSSESAVIRQWARANNIPCPKVGAVPKDVRAAYEAAVSGAA